MEHTKVIAMYLPQYHTFKENDEWWGQGFTEWTNVKKSRPLYKGHLQPRIPYEENYYDLSDENVMKQQMEMAVKYKVDGFCFYHYWFEGKKLMEKPVERLLTEQKVSLPFCLCWANEAWTRTWDGNEGAKQILISQQYGSQEDWESHFRYLNLFFQHDQYIKVNGKPMFVIYNSSKIKQKREMYIRWNQLAREMGYDGLYILNIRRSINGEIPFYGDGIVDFEPHASLFRMSQEERSQMTRIYRGNRIDNRGVRYHVLDYEKFCEHMVKRYTASDSNHFLGFFAGWDNTPRRGINTELIFENNTPQNFEKYFEIQYKRSMELNNKFLFINAWNEWGEGTCLEPDQEYGFSYLEAVKKVKGKY